MAKPDSKLVATPVTELCGSPSSRDASVGSDSSVYGMKGPDGVSAGVGADPVLLYTGIAGSTPAPSDKKTFQGVND